MKPANHFLQDRFVGSALRLRYDLRPLWAALAVATAYYLGARLGLALTFEPVPVSVLWPPNAVLMSALLLTPVRWWWLILAAALPAHLIAELQSGVPTLMVLCWFVSNTAEALIGALLVRHFISGQPTLDKVRNVLVFFCAAVVAAPFWSSFLDAAFVTLIGWGQSGYWEVWNSRFISNVLATLTIVPVALAWIPRRNGDGWIRRGRRLEAGFLVCGLLLVGIGVFDIHASQWLPAAFLYLPLPFLLWAALRFGPRGLSAAFAIVAFMVIWGAAHGRGPFVGDVAAESALSVQVFLVSVGVPLLFLAAVIKEHKNTLRGLRESEERFATAFRASPDAMVISRLSDGRIIEVNDRWQGLFGYARHDVIGVSMRDLHIYANELARCRLLGAFEQGGVLREGAVELRARDGTALHTICSSEQVEIGGETCFITIIRDVTRQSKTDLQLREQRKQLTHLTRVARLSELSGSLAHELNQPLTAILSNAQAAQRFLMREPLDLTEIRSILHDIVEADKRAGEVIRGLRVLMKKGDDQFAPLELNDIVRDTLVFAHSDLISHGVVVATRLSADVPSINGDRVQLQQLLLNLLSNAGEAMDINGRSARQLTITTALGAHGTAQLLVADNGPGLRSDQQERVFEPFYTTKEHGLGLGLSICRTIVEAHGGRIHAENSAAGGATFRAVFPALEQTI